VPAATLLLLPLLPYAPLLLLLLLVPAAIHLLLLWQLGQLQQHTSQAAASTPQQQWQRLVLAV
jgi:hypothetical protein